MLRYFYLRENGRMIYQRNFTVLLYFFRKMPDEIEDCVLRSLNNYLLKTHNRVCYNKNTHEFGTAVLSLIYRRMSGA